MVYYVVHKGRNPGIYTSWDKCKKEIEKFEGAIFKKFTDKNEASAFLKVGFGEGKKPRIVTRRENEDKKNNEKILDETICEEETIFIYTDGSCIRLENITKAGYGIYIPEKNIQDTRAVEALGKVSADSHISPSIKRHTRNSLVHLYHTVKPKISSTEKIVRKSIKLKRKSLGLNAFGRITRDDEEITADMLNPNEKVTSRQSMI